MNPEMIDAFDAFWSQVRQAERFIEEYGHTGWRPAYRDFRSGPLERAYEGIRTHLDALVRLRFVRTPVAVQGLDPYPAETAHQALMFFLNPPQNLFGSPGVLGSPEYQSLKRDAQDELARLESPRPKAARRGRRRSPKKGPRPSRRNIDARTLVGLLMEHHFSPDRASAVEPLQQKQIAKELGWDQSRVSRAFKELFGARGMSVYHAAFQADRLRGFLTRQPDGMADVEAFSE